MNLCRSLLPYPRLQRPCLVDTLIVVPNDRLAAVHKISILDAFQKADEVLYQAVRGISDIITGTGYINVDFADVKNIMSENGGQEFRIHLVHLNPMEQL